MVDEYRTVGHQLPQAVEGQIVKALWGTGGSLLLLLPFLTGQPVSLLELRCSVLPTPAPGNSLLQSLLVPM